MATIENGILSSVNGRIGNVVGYMWKGKNCLRQYVIPSDRKSDAQLDYRDKIKFITNYGKFNYPHIVKPQMSLACEGENYSPWNLYLKQNLAVEDVRNNLELLKISKGICNIPSITSSVIDGFTGDFVLNWSTSTDTFGDPTDKINIFSVSAGSYYISRLDSGSVIRSDGSFTLSYGSYDLTVDHKILVVAESTEYGFSDTTGSIVSEITP